MSNHDDAAFVRNFSMVLVGLCIVGILAFILAKIVNRSAQEGQAPSTTAAARVAPMGQVNTGSEAVAVGGSGSPAPAAGPAAAGSDAPVAAADLGKSVYDKACFACHAQGIAGAPKHADMAAWEARLEQGVATLYDHAINGYTGSAGMMPPRGGNPSLSDDEVKAAVDYMLAAVGGGGGTTAPAAAEEPAAPAPSAATEDTAAEPAADAATDTAAAPAAADAARGKEIYDAACFVCHTPGAAGAPKLGDNAAWASRIEKGLDALYHGAINGFMGNAGMMRL